MSLLHRTGCFALILLIAALPAAAHETDQYTLPAGRKFADLGPYFNNFLFGCIDRGVAKTNARIKQAIAQNKSPAEIAELQSFDTVAHAVNREFPYAIFYIEDLDKLSTSPQMMQRYPGYLTGFKPPPSVQKLALFPLNPFRAWGCATMKIYGCYVGTDKIGHFTDMGMHYYQTYRGFMRKGLSEEQAIRKAIEVGISDPLKGESGLLGYWTAGDYSNADLVSNYMGMLFYRNLTEPTMLKGEIRPPMLKHDGPYWKLASHVRKDSDFFAWFISDHLDEAMNPGHFLPNMREGMRGIAADHAEGILNHRTDEHGNRRSQGWFAQRSRELRTYWGVDYGFRGNDQELILIDQVCFASPKSPAQRDARGRMPIHRAIEAGDGEAVARYLASGANANDAIRSSEQFSPEWGNTPLHLAARDGRDDIVRLLLSRGADVNARNDRGITPLHLAVTHESTLQLLLDAGASADLADARGRTPLHWAATDSQTPAVALLLVRGAKPNARDRDGRTPLHLAAAGGRATVVTELLRRGADVNAPDSMNQRPLHLAASQSKGEAAEILLRSGASVALKDDFGRTALHNASRRGAVQIATILLEQGAPAGARDAYGITPADQARRAGFVSLANAIRDGQQETLASEKQMAPSTGNGASHR